MTKCGAHSGNGRIGGIVSQGAGTGMAVWYGKNVNGY